MNDESSVTVIRYGHRPGRDDRMTTHVGLTARALGADRVFFPSNATQAQETVEDITTRFGGVFQARCSDELDAYIRDFDDMVVHLTMYGEPIQAEIAAIRADAADTDLLVIVGGKKVPFSVYEQADWNVAVTNQPHSEVASLAVFLDRLFEGTELSRSWPNAERKVIPQSTGKRVIDTDDSV